MPGFGFGFGLGARRPAIPSVPAAPYASVQTEADVMDWIAATGGGASAVMPRWPGVPDTVGNGLGLLLDLAKLGSEGVHFSRNAALAQPAAGTAHPQWTSPRIKIDNADPAGGRLVQNYSVAGYVNVLLSDGSEALIEDTVVDGEGQTIYFGLRQDTTGSAMIARRCEIRNCISAGVVLKQGTVADSFIHTMNGDAFKLQTTQPKLLLRNMVRKLGQASGAHGDVVQSEGNAGNALSFGNLFYLPYFENGLNEGAFGTNAVLNYSNLTQATELADLLSVNDALIGGRSAVQLNATNNALVNGAALIGTWFSPVGGDYTDMSDFYPQDGASTGRSKNILVHNCRHLGDGSPVTKNGSDAQGLWDYDKAIAPARFRQVCRMLGYLDSNDDPLVTVRTGFHPGQAA